MNRSLFRFKPAQRQGFTLVEVMIVVLIIGILLAIALPNFVYTRESSRTKSCVANLRAIQMGKDAYMMDKNRPSDTPQSEFTDTVLYGAVGGVTGYVQQKPMCPGGGTYTVGAGNVFPACDYNGGGVHKLF